jgi:uncharacterized membrane protein
MISDPRFPRLVYFLLLAAGVSDWVRNYARMPARMASHFGANGQPNGWQTKEMFFVFTVGAVLMISVVGFVIPWTLSAMPNRLINLPQKEYWLAAERRAETFRFFGTQMGWFGCAVLFVILYAISQAIQANLPEGHFNSGGMWLVLVAFVVFSIVWLVHFLLHFSRVPQKNSLHQS